MSTTDSSLPSPRAAKAAHVFAALGDRTRLSLLQRLGDGRSRSIASLSSDVWMTRQAVTKHLQILEHAGLVRSNRVGRESRYTLDPGAITQAQSYLDEVSRQWDEALGRLRTFLAEGQD